jgi:hypothetical protein
LLGLLDIQNLRQNPDDRYVLSVTPTGFHFSKNSSPYGGLFSLACSQDIRKPQSPIIALQREQGCRAAWVTTSEEDPDSIGQGDG